MKVKLPKNDNKKVLVKHKKTGADTTYLSYATGRRKTSVSRVWLKAGTGRIMINKKELDDYFVRPSHRKTLLQPFVVTSTESQYDVIATVKGGGVSGQAGALLHGLARAIDSLVPESHKKLHDAGFLTRDSREVERKKYGRLKARKKTPFKRR